MDFKTNVHYFHKSYLTLYIGVPLFVISTILVYGNLLPAFILNPLTINFIEIKTDIETLLIPSHNDSMADDLIKIIYIRKEKA